MKLPPKKNSLLIWISFDGYSSTKLDTKVYLVIFSIEEENLDELMTMM
jgi:hypothetical protein